MFIDRQKYWSSVDHTVSSGDMWRKMKWIKGFKGPRSQVPKQLVNELLLNLTPDYVSPNPPLFLNNDTVLNEPITMSELTQCLKQAKNTSPGYDAIPYCMLRHLPSNGKEILLTLFNNFFTAGFIPNQWRDITVVAIPKPGREVSSISSLRPISMMSCICKLFHSIINKRLEWFCEQKGLFSNNTTGFRKAHSTYDSLSSLVTNIQIGFSNKKCTVGCFLDIDNAYNNIDISSLLKIINDLGVGIKICTYLWNFLKERRLTIQLNDGIMCRSTGRGLGQGDPTSILVVSSYLATSF